METQVSNCVCSKILPFLNYLKQAEMTAARKDIDDLKRHLAVTKKRNAKLEDATNKSFCLFDFCWSLILVTLIVKVVCRSHAEGHVDLVVNARDGYLPRKEVHANIA
jgi:hypothetical protein